MYLEEFGFSYKNLHKILHELNSTHDFQLDLSLNKSELKKIYEQYNSVKTTLLLETPYNVYFNNSEYSKATLICEAIRLFLSEIAPARKGAKVKTKKMQKMGEASLNQFLSKNDQEFIDNIESQEGLVGNWVPVSRFNRSDYDMIEHLEKEGRVTIKREGNKLLVNVVEGLDLQMIKEMEHLNHFNKLVDAATTVAKRNSVKVTEVFNAYKQVTNSTLLNSEDKSYHLGQIAALKLLENIDIRQMVENAQKTLDEQKELISFLINKAKGNGGTIVEQKRYVLSAHNALMNVDLKKI